MLSGRRLDLLHPCPDDIAIGDIAHGLARVARWNGQTRGPDVFSVAQHCVLVETIAGGLEPGLPAAGRLTALLHDGPEYVIGDLISPFKGVIGDAYKAIERGLLDAILARFGVPAPAPALGELIKRADQIAAYLEAVHLAGFDADEAGTLFGVPPDDVTWSLAGLSPLRAQAAEAAFLARFDNLSAGLTRLAERDGRS